MPAARRAIEVLGPLGLAALFAALAAWSWGKWTDVQIDFGTELYVQEERSFITPTLLLPMGTD